MSPPFYNRILPLVLPFWTPKKEAKEDGSPQGEPMRYAQPYGSFTVGIVGRGLDPSGQISDNTRFSGRIWNPPLRQPKILAPEGSIGEGRKSVKKSAALLRFLAFLALDHPFGVPRGKCLAAASEQRDFFRFLFWSQKRKALRENPTKKGRHRKVVSPANANKKTQTKISITNTSAQQITETGNSPAPSQAAMMPAANATAPEIGVWVA